MNEEPKQNENNTDEFESLYQSLRRTERSKPSQKQESSSKPEEETAEEVFQTTKRRKRAAQSQKESTHREESALQRPLDIESARSEMLMPEEPPQEEKDEKGPSLRERLGLSKTHMRILSILSVAVLLVYLALIVVLLNRGSLTAAPPPTEAANTTSQPREEALPTLRPTQTPTPAPPKATPSPTPTSRPQVTTRLDLQVMRDPDNVELRIERGFEYVRLNAYQSAVKDFQHALELSPENPQAFLGLGQAYYYQLQWQKAEEALGTAVAFEEDLEQPHFWLGKLYYLQGRYEESAAEFDWAAEINRDNPVNEAWLGRAAAKLEDIEEARGAAERALGLDQEVAIAHVARAEAYVLEEEYEAAHGDLLYAKNLEPHDFEVLNALARFYAVHMPERMVEAERLAQQAEQWARWDIEVARALHTQAKIRIAQERTEEAKELLAAASDLATANGKIQLPGLVEDFDKLLQP